MGQLRTEWLSLATKDLALFHICLSHYAGNYGLAKQESDPTEALHFRMESMRLVNRRLDNGEAALSDGTISTVASLSSYEVRSLPVGNAVNRNTNVVTNLLGNQWIFVSSHDTFTRPREDGQIKRWSVRKRDELVYNAFGSLVSIAHCWTSFDTRLTHAFNTGQI